MPALGEDTDRRLAELAIARGLVDPVRARAVAEERTVRIQRGERLKPLAVVLCDMGLLDRAKAAALLKEIRTERRSGVHETLPLPGLARPRAADTAGKIRQYAIVRELGKGGMGVVYEAFDTTLKRKVAIKMILDAARAGAEDLERFRREAQAAARVPHPGIVQVFETGEHEGKPFLVMELVEGESFEALLKREAVAPRRVAEIVRGVAVALEHAHAHHIVHRDVKPANVLLDKEGKPHLTDFGLARDEAVTAQLTVTGDVLGTPAYMAPEQARGVPGEQGPHTDVYALGGLLYRALSGKAPFEAANAQALLYKVLTQEPVPFREAKANVHADLETIALRCLEKEPARRYKTAGAVAEDLRRFLDGEPILARPTGGFERAARFLRRNKLAAAGLVLIAALPVLVPAGVLYWRSEEDKAGRRQVIAQARAEALARAAAFAKARKEGAYAYDPFNADTVRAARNGLLDPGRDALAATVRFHDLAVTLRGGPEPVQEAERLRYDTAVALGEVAIELDELLVAEHAYEDASRLGNDPSHASKTLADLRAHGEASTMALELCASVARAVEKGDVGLAGKVIAEALSKDGRCAAAHYYRGVVAWKERRLDAAVEGFETAIRLKPRYVAANAQLGLLHVLNGETRKALDEARRAIDLDPTDPLGHYVEAQAYHDLGDAVRSRKAIEEGARLCEAGGTARDRVKVLVLRLRGTTRDEEGNPRGAEADFTEALEVGGPDGDLYVKRSNARTHLGDHAGALSDLREALKLTAAGPMAALLRKKIAELEAGQ